MIRTTKQMKSLSKNIRFDLKLITPRYAEELLKLNTDNYRLHRSYHVKHLARLMKQDKWLLSPQPIVISPKRVLLDGQHRLMAVSRSGVSIWMYVCFNFPEECLSGLDNNALVRSGVDYLRYQCVDNPGSVNPLLTIISEVKCGGTGAKAKLSNEERYKMAVEYQDAIESIYPILSSTYLGKMRSNSVIGALVYAYSKYPKQAVKWANSLAQNYGAYPAKSPARRLFLHMESPDFKTSSRRRLTVLTVLKLFSCYLDGHNVSPTEDITPDEDVLERFAGRKLTLVAKAA